MKKIMPQLAVGFGTLVILAEIVSVITSGEPDFWPMWFKNVVVGAVLISSAVAAKRDGVNGERFLAAGWAFACGLFSVSVLASIEAGKPLWLAVVLTGYSGISLLGAIVALRKS